MIKNVISVIFLLFIPFYSLGENICRPMDNLTKLYFINGVGNTKETREISVLILQEALNSQEITPLVNPMNNENGDFLRNKLGTPFTWDEIKEVFQQKKQEVVKSQIVDKNTVESMLDSIDKERVNIVIAHSQGNLYANSLCLLNKGKIKQKNIAIATPASTVECGDSKNDYITLINDLVIVGLGTLTESMSNLKNPLPPNMTILPNKNDLSGHGLVETYLSNQKSRKYIQGIYNRKLEESKMEELDFNIVDLKLTKLADKDKSIFRNIGEGIDEKYTNISLTIRQNIASFKVLGYLKDVFNSGFFSALINLRFNSLNKKELNKVFDLPIQVSSDREYADIVGYVLDTIYPYCSQYRSFLPQNIKNFCNNYTPYFSRKEYKELAIFDKYSISGSHKGLKWNSSEKKLSLNCLDALKDQKDFIVSLEYSPESTYSSVMINGMEFKIHPQNLLNSSKEKEEIISVSFSVENEKILPHIQKKTDILNYYEIESLSQNENFENCNTLNKLFQNSCSGYFLALMKKNR